MKTITAGYTENLTDPSLNPTNFGRPAKGPTNPFNRIRRLRRLVNLSVETTRIVNSLPASLDE